MTQRSVLGDFIARETGPLRITIAELESQVSDLKRRLAEKTDAHDKDGRALLAMHKLVYNTCENCTQIITDIGMGGMKCSKCGTVAGKAGLILQVSRLNSALAEAVSVIGGSVGDLEHTQLRIDMILKGTL